MLFKTISGRPQNLSIFRRNMAGKESISAVMVMLLFCLLPYTGASDENFIVPEFGIGFDEVVIADSNDALDDPRDLEFHPGRTDELWVANRGDDSITIVHNTGSNEQYSENRKDSHAYHFLEEVSAIAFGEYHPEFDWTWGSAQETQNTYCGQGEANQFMGPTLWPSSLSHFAVENQNNGNGLLGSHIDMNHESPDGMGIAHDSDNAYWYNDGYYGELVYYDFQEDHDTGQDDHSDAIIRRYSDIGLSRAMGIPGHMILDKQTGILYIADTGANRVLWVNTDDTTYNTENILDPLWYQNPSSTQKEDLAEYSVITGVEWGVLDTGLSRPSGIALEAGRLFISENGNGAIVAYELSTNGKSATEIDSIQTSASSIMGLEIGPNGYLYYVDNGRDQVIRVDPYTDHDNDGVVDEFDNCPLIFNPSQSDHDFDLLGDACDSDDDGDGLEDEYDDCNQGLINWTSSHLTDYDSDGCADANEDFDDDNDGISDYADNCQIGELGWISTSILDYDSDGCKDMSEDLDDDGDHICDSYNSNTDCRISSAGEDLCPFSPSTFDSQSSNDIDYDGCEDYSEDDDDDNDGFLDEFDNCPLISGTSEYGSILGCEDTDGDGFADSIDIFPSESTQWFDIDEDGYGDEPSGVNGDNCPGISGSSNFDRLGCPDTDGDGWSNPDLNWNTSQGADAFYLDSTQYIDSDGDGFGDSSLGNQPDACPIMAGNSTNDMFGCIDSDGDGWSDFGDQFPADSTQYQDTDMDGYGDSLMGKLPDSCPETFGGSTEQRYGCPDTDGDGWGDEIDDFEDDYRFWSDRDGDGYPDQMGTNLSDDCPDEPGKSTEELIGCPDSDLDGWADQNDAYPKDSSRYLATNYSILIILFFISSLAICGGILTLKRRQNTSKNGDSYTDGLLNPVISNADVITVPSAMPSTPALPAEGLPEGWTMEQWQWYGSDYLEKNR